MISISLFSSRLLLAAAVLAGAACTSGNPAGQLIASTGLGPTQAKPQDFVVASRPGTVDFIPIQPQAPGRPTPAKTAAQVKEVETEMDSLRERNASAGAAAAELGGTPPPDPVLLPAPKRAKKPASTQ
jgi:hypothetical protein